MVDDGRTIEYMQNNRKCVTRTICFRCNNRCISCITDFEVHRNNPEFTTDEVKSIIDNIDDDVSTIDFNGGEPTLRKDLFEILRYTRERFPNSLIQLLTNGRMFAYQKYVNDFTKLRLNNFNFFITLYGHTAKVHDSITRTPRSFEQTVKGIKNLLRNNCSIEIRVVINKMNYKHMPEIADFILENFKGIFRLVFINLKLTGEAYKNRKYVVMDYKEVVPFVTNALDKIDDKLNTRLFHFPLCILPKKYWKYAKGVTIVDDQIVFPNCDSCKGREDCAGVWKSYVDVKGNKEFKAL